MTQKKSNSFFTYAKGHFFEISSFLQSQKTPQGIHIKLENRFCPKWRQQPPPPPKRKIEQTKVSHLVRKP